MTKEKTNVECYIPRIWILFKDNDPYDSKVLALTYTEAKCKRIAFDLMLDESGEQGCLTASVEQELTLETSPVRSNHGGIRYFWREFEVKKKYEK